MQHIVAFCGIGLVAALVALVEKSGASPWVVWSLIVCGVVFVGGVSGVFRSKS